MNPPSTGGIVIPDESPATYYKRSLDVANHTGLTIIDSRSPAHFKHWVENPQDDTDNADFAFGRAFHCATLEPDVFHRTYVVLPANAPAYPAARSWSAKNPNADVRRAMDWWLNFQSQHPGRQQMTAADYDRALFMAQSIRNHSDAVAGLLIGGKREVTFRWADEDTGVQCKARVDQYERGQFMLDLKKTRDASFEAFARSVASYRYDQQAAHYSEGARVCDGSKQQYVILACEDYAPYVCQPYFLDAMAEERGWNLRQRAIRKQAEALRTGIWRGYDTGFSQLSLPTYAYYGIEADQ